MAELRIGDFVEGFTLYFETPEERINAYALASALVNLADAAKAANRRLNPAGIDIEIVVEALASGSFRAKIAALMRESGIFTPQAVGTLLLGILSTYIYEHTLAKHDSVVVEVMTDEVIVTQGETRIVVPRSVHDATQVVAKDPTFTKAVDKMMMSVTTDPRITGFGLSMTVDGPPPGVILPRSVLEIRDSPPEEESKNRTIEEDCDLYIVKAIMEKGTRKWGFRWRGINISAPIIDKRFYTDFSAHNITIAPGDEFQARLAIKQVRDDFSGVYANKSYEVVTVYKHVPKLQPRRLPMAAAQ